MPVRVRPRVLTLLRERALAHKGTDLAVCVLLAATTACGARSDLDASSRTRGGSQTGDRQPDDGDRPLPPPPPRCDDVAYSACTAWPAPVVVSRFEDGRSLFPDVAWFDGVHVVTYGTLHGDSVRAATLDANGTVLWNEGVGEPGEARIAFHPGFATGVVSTEHGVRWLGADGVPRGTFMLTEPSGISSDSVNHDVFGTPDGFGTVVAPTSDPGNVSEGVFGLMPPTEGSITWLSYRDDNVGPALEHATGADGLVHRLVVEDSAEAIFVYDWAQGPAGPVALYPLNGATTFNDGFVTDGTTSFVQRANQNVMTFLQLSEGGETIVHSLSLDTSETAGPHVERLGTANGLREIVVADVRIAEGWMSVAHFDPIRSEIIAPLIIGPTGRNPRMSRTSRGLAVTWVDAATGEVLLNALDCCVAP